MMLKNFLRTSEWIVSHFCQVFSKYFEGSYIWKPSSGFILIPVQALQLGRLSYSIYISKYLNDRCKVNFSSSQDLKC